MESVLRFPLKDIGRLRMERYQVKAKKRFVQYKAHTSFKKNNLKNYFKFILNFLKFLREDGTSQ